MKSHTPLSIALLLLLGPSLVAVAQEVESSSPDSSPGIIASYPEASKVWRNSSLAATTGQPSPPISSLQPTSAALMAMETSTATKLTSILRSS